MDMIESAFASVKRETFLPEQERSYASMDMPLPIGFGQTNSQPTTVRAMLKWLEVVKGQKVLDVGSGSGWTSALLSYLVGAKGMVVAVERVPELVRFGRNNCKSLGIKNVEFFLAGKKLGWQEEAPYDRILVSAAADELPMELVDQLANSGRMVVPVGNNIYVVDKNEKGEVSQNIFSGFVFVPLITK